MSVEENRATVAAILEAQAGPGQRATIRNVWREAFMSILGAGKPVYASRNGADETVLRFLECDMLPGAVLP